LDERTKHHQQQRQSRQERAKVDSNERYETISARVAFDAISKKTTLIH
jgi:hypothetical protein